MNYQFLITLSISELIFYPDEFEEYHEAQAAVRQLAEELGIDFPMTEIYDRYLKMRVNTGDVLLFRAGSGKNLIVIDTYREPYDQLNVVRFGAQIAGTDERLPSVRRLFRELHDGCEVQIRYEEGQGILHNMINPANYPLDIRMDPYRYEQQLKVFGG
ncbi:hypothetical protein [Saccharibacillus alkalitolerans]|uniref:Uncharacterized protein n=1 Tax=Saccharibacillus alkalitolerans TaxID=2705290 RepID=A0ABX0F7J5_9BACL|nr:hypothetical protein [Saccharibacillus alkalitolerans]NGZ76936.1 hypothetical protein [Saccharibacillus alkalitolerans]